MFCFIVDLGETRLCALQLSKSGQTRLQIARFSDTIDGSAMVGPVSGELSAEQALKSLLGPNGLSFKMVNDRTIAIIRTGSAASKASGSRTLSTSGDEMAQPDGGNQGGSSKEESFWSRFRLAQVDQGGTASSPAVEKKREQASQPLLEEIIVTAQKREERLQDVPISISVLGGKGLDKSSFQGVTDALATVPGVTTIRAQSGGVTQIVVRGVGAGGPVLSGSSPIAYYLDSVPFGFVKSATVPDPNIYDLQRIEVLRGPQGTLYGANAENGVVRVLTNDANPNAFELKARTLFSTTHEGGGNYGGDAAINVPVVEGKLAVRAVVDYQNSSGWINGPLGNHLNDAELRSYRFKINAQPTDAVSIGLSASSTRNHFGASSVSRDDRTISALIPEPISTDYDIYAFKFGYEFPSFSLSSTTSYLDYAINQNIIDFGVDAVGFRLGTPLSNQFFSRIFSEEMILSSAPNSSWHWTGGAFYRDGKDRLISIITGISRVPTDRSEGSKSSALFGQFGRRFLKDQLEWTLGLRYFHDDVLSQENVQAQGLPNVPLIHKTATFNATTPRAVLTWYPSNGLTVYGSYSEGFRSGFPQNPSILHVAPNFPPAKPDKLHNYEIGAKGDLLDKRISLDTALYYVKWKDVQQVLTVPYGPANIPVAAFVNAQSASGAGVDFALTARPLEGLQLGVTCGWNDLKMDADVFSQGVPLFAKGDRLNFSPEFTGGVSADYSFPIGGGFNSQFSVSGNYSSKQTDHFINRGISVVNTGDTLLNVRTAFAIVSPAHWSATLFVDNITNNYGAVPPFGFPVPEISPRPRPRTMGVEFDYKF